MRPEIATVAGQRRDRIGKSAGHGWLGVPAALTALAVNGRFFAARQPGTPLRVLSLIAIDAPLRQCG